ncbi:MAG: HD domain-containing protein [Anaerolineae bacterium]|nr:HD domain-containing protein [Anaerolineae bacterium]MDW8068544.1 HD domain-containing protein [Anaerolineae bacterium]
MTPITLPAWPWDVVHRIAAERGVRVWPVGGGVRDLLMGRPVHDWDFAVDQDALGLARAVADTLKGTFYPLDEERDTGRVIVRREGRRIELDFARLRGPDLEADLRDRDFTINAIAVGPDGELIDPTGGLADLEARRVRAVGPQAFDRDPLRMLRAVRIVAELGLRLEVRTAQWIIERARELPRAAPERIRDEFARLLNARSVAYHLQLLDELGLMTSILPDVEALREQHQTPPHRYAVWWHTLMTVDATEHILRQVGAIGGPGHKSLPPDYADAPDWAWDQVQETLAPFAPALVRHLRRPTIAPRYRRTLLLLAALLHDVGKPLTVTEEVKPGQTHPILHFYGHEAAGARRTAGWMRDMRFSRAETESVATMVRAHLRPSQVADAPGGVTGRAAYRFFRATGDAGVEIVLLALADHLAIWGPNLQPERWARRRAAARALLEYFFHQSRGAIAPPPLVNGHDLMAELGLPEGPEVGRLLEAIREAQAAGEVTTREEALALARRLVSPKG